MSQRRRGRHIGRSSGWINAASYGRASNFLGLGFTNLPAGGPLMKLHFWTGVGAAHKPDRSKVPDTRKPPDGRSIIVGAVIAMLAVAGLFFLVHNLHF
jgi:hypothetical protein